MWVSYNTKSAIAVLALLSLFACKKRNPLPELRFVNETTEVGTLYTSNPVVTFDVVYVNEGSQALSVFDVIPSCECTTISSVDSLTATGKEGHIRGTLDMTGYPEGRFAKEIVVFSDGVERSVHYMLTGELKYTKNK